MTGASRRAASKTSVPVTRARAGDEQAFAELHALCFEQGWDAKAVRGLLADAGCIPLTARDQGALAGMVIARAAAGEAEILTLAVHPDARGTGIGEALMRAAVAALKGHGVHRLYLEVAESNTAARALYAKLGCRETGRRKRYYAAAGGHAAEDALVLELDLDRS